MNPARARVLLVAALLLGVSGDLFFRVPTWGLNLVGWVALAVFAALIGEWVPGALHHGPRGRDLAVALGATFVAAAGTVLHDAPTLYFFDLVAMLTAAAVAVWVMRGRSLARFRVRDLLRAWSATAGTALIGAPVLALRDAEWERPGQRDDRRLRAAVVGTILAVPPVVVVGSLLAEADPLFGDFLSSWHRLGLQELGGHVVLAAVIAWPAAGWLRGVLSPPLDAHAGTFPPPSRIDFVGVAPALYAVVGLLAAYLGLQARALFGGQAYVEATSGLTYAEYARRGFFELVAVTAIVLLLLLLADWALDRSRPAATDRYRKVGWVLLTLLGVLMASALQRMWLYVSYYGLSDTRLYATAGIVWLVAAAGWFGWTILRGRRARFGVGLLVLSAGWLAGLNVLDPERVVVRVNLGRALAGAEFDVAYHTSLSADAVPALLEAARRLGPAQCSAILTGLGSRQDLASRPGADWRSWSLPRSRASHLLAPTPGLLSGPRCDDATPPGR